jgi:hypothetical protein
MARTILVAVKDLLFGSKIQTSGKRTETPLLWASRFEPLPEVVAQKRPDVLVADVGEPGMLEALRVIRAASPELRIVGFLGHTLEEAAAEAEVLGVELFTKGQFSAQVDRILVRERDGG